MVLKNVSLLAAALLLAGTSCQMVAKGPQLKAGMNRSAVGFGFWSTEEDPPAGASTDTDTIMVNVTHGWFVTNDLEVGGQVVYDSEDVSGATTSETTSWVLAALARWYFSGGSSLYPYVEGSVGIGNVDFGASDDDLLRYALGVGVMQFITASTALDAILKYQADSYDTSDVDETGFHVELAYSVFW
jgi:hypothetical protein